MLVLKGSQGLNCLIASFFILFMYTWVCPASWEAFLYPCCFLKLMWGHNTHVHAALLGHLAVLSSRSTASFLQDPIKQPFPLGKWFVFLYYPKARDYFNPPKSALYWSRLRLPCFLPWRITKRKTWIFTSASHVFFLGNNAQMYCTESLQH